MVAARHWRRCAAVILLAIHPVSTWAEPVAVAVSVTNDAVVERGSKRLRLIPRGQIENGDVIRTGSGSQVQILFRDRTRVAVGPNARFKINDVEMDAQRRATRFSLSFLAGAYRFLSGRSSKDVYEISTPTATMGVRGTTFDVTIDNRRRTNLALFDGSVEFCTRRTRCALLLQGCAMVQSVGFGRFAPPDSRAERDKLIARWFPFVVSQRSLGGSFRARTESCGEIEGVTYNIPAQAPRLVPAPAQSTVPPSPPAATNGANINSGGFNDDREVNGPTGGGAPGAGGGSNAGGGGEPGSGGGSNAGGGAGSAGGSGTSGGSGPGGPKDSGTN